MNAFYSFLRGVLYVPIKLLFPVKVVGKENIPLPKRVITVSNHLSALDIVLVAINVKGFRHIVAKKELKKNKFFGKCMDIAGCIAVDRGTADLSAVRQALTVLKKNESITIFPEGTRNKNGENLQEVKAGASMFALKGNAEIVPIMLLHKQRFFKRNYMYVGKAVSLDDVLVGGRVDSAAVERGANKIEHIMQSSLDYLRDYVENKRWKEIKREKKAAKKRFKAYGKQAKRAAKRMKKQLKLTLK